MIFAHHAGEDLLVSALATGGASAAAGMLLVARTKLSTVIRRLWPPRR